MNDKKQYLTVGLMGVLVVLVVSVLWRFSPVIPERLGGNAFQATTWNSASTSVSFSVTTSKRILASSTVTAGTGTTRRVYANICNDSSNKVYLNMNADKPANLNGGAGYVGFPLAANTCYPITDLNLYRGSIQASSTNEAASTITVYSAEL